MRNLLTLKDPPNWEEPEPSTTGPAQEEPEPSTTGPGQDEPEPEIPVAYNEPDILDR